MFHGHSCLNWKRALFKRKLYNADKQLIFGPAKTEKSRVSAELHSSDFLTIFCLIHGHAGVENIQFLTESL